ncbi:hypothetical protein [Streptomyces chartreusis]|uniref:hypothetical protein n=1 Tax=Streptomyces chartreusis TaxID=1969 RepID=UPI0036C6ACEA
MLIVTREGGRRWELPAFARPLITLVYLRKHDTLAQIAVASRREWGAASAAKTSLAVPTLKPAPRWALGMTAPQMS